MEMRPGKVLIGEAEIVLRVGQLAREINEAYAGAPVTIVGVLDGCLLFLADLLRRFEMPVEVVLVRVKTYGDSRRPHKEPVIHEEDLARVAGRDVLVIDDIYDSGATLRALKKTLLAQGAEDVKLCALLEKERRHECGVQIDFKGFDVADVFVVGYGLDYAGLYRNLPYIAALEGHDEDGVLV